MWLVSSTGIVLVALTGGSESVTLPVKLVEELLLATGGLLFSVGAVAFSYWKKCQPIEKIEAARKAGRPICGCTEDGVIMLLDAKRSDRRGLFICPLCKWEVLEK